MTKDNHEFCSAPFTQLVLKPDGKVSPCCYLYHINLGNVKEKSLKDIWNDKPIQKMRSEFTRSVPKACRSKIKYIACNRSFKHLDAVIDRSPIQERPPQKLDLRLNGQCNLSCVMCDVWKEPNRTYDQTSFWTEGPLEIFPFLKELEILGGEPFIQKDTFKLIDAVNACNQHCLWSFVTNGHYQFSKRLEQALNSIKIKQIQISLDSLNPMVYQHIRKKGNLELTLSTINQFVHFRKKYREEFGFDFTFIVSMCVLKSNRFEVPHFLEYCHQIGAGAQFQHAYYDPSKQESLVFLTRKEKTEYLSFLRSSTEQRDGRILRPFTIVDPVFRTI